MPRKRKLTLEKLYARYTDLLSERAEFEQEWQQISNYLVPGRGIYQRFAKPKKRKLTSPRVINNTAEDALYVLTSGMHGALTSPSRPWFRIEWEDEQLNEIEPLKAWLETPFEGGRHERRVKKIDEVCGATKSA